MESFDEQELSALMKAAQAGDSSAYRLLLSRVHTMMKSYVRNAAFKDHRASTELSEDVIQEILLALHAQRHTYNPNQPFLPWLYAIARYKTIDFIRQNYKTLKNTSLSVELHDVADLREEDPMNEHDLDVLLQGLPPAHRELIELVKIRELSIEEAAQRTGLSQANVKVIILRAMKSL